MASEFEAFYAYCLVDGPNNDPDKGFLIPVFTGDEFRPVASIHDEFPNNGKIWVSKGFDSFCSGIERHEFVKAKVAFVNTSWENNPTDQRNSKYSTFEGFMERVPTFTINSIAEGAYPDPSDPSSFVAITHGRPPSSTVFIRTTDTNGSEVLLGPFEPLEKTFESFPEGTRFSYQPIERPVRGEWAPLMEASAVAFAFDVDLIPNACFRNQGEAEYLVETANLPFATAGLVDFCSDEYLVRWASKEIRQKTSKKPEASKLHAELISIASSLKIPDTVLQSRLVRLENIEPPTDASAVGPQNLKANLVQLLDTEDGKNILETYINTHKKKIVDEFLAGEISQRRELELKTLNEELVSARTRINEEKETLERSIAALRTQHESEKAKSLTDEIEKLEHEINEKQESLQLFESVEALRGIRTSLEADVRSIQNQHAKAKTLLEETQSDIRKTDETHKRRLLELKTDLDVLSGNVTERKPAAKYGVHATPLEVDYDDDVHLLREFILNDVYEHLSDLDYQVEKETLLGLVVSMTQNLICTVSGPPGSGKSSLISNLAKVMGLKANENFVRVQVQRGWTTDRELLGFKNRLSHSYEPDSFGVHQLIQELQDSPDDKWLGLVMLDEANLSPLEHYWASFMGATDDPASFKCDPNVVGLPPRLRFLATINSDSTTEPLSPRFVDRSPVIRLLGRSHDVSIFSGANSVVPQREVQIGYDLLHTAFLENLDPELTRDEVDVLNALADIQKTGVFNLSTRSMHAIIKFVSVSRELFTEISGRRGAALDYATALHLLPAITGQGRPYRKKLDDLAGLLGENRLQYSEEVVSNIIENSEYDAYSFFNG